MKLWKAPDVKIVWEIAEEGVTQVGKELTISAAQIDMKDFDGCIVIANVNSIVRQGAYAIILEFITTDDVYAEVWDFDRFDGATMDVIPINKLRLATENETEEYIKKFNIYAGVGKRC